MPTNAHTPPTTKIMNNVSLVFTVLNEERSMRRLLESILQQTRKPDEVVIVDGGSTDATARIVHEFSTHHSDPPIRFSVVPGNRAVGRNAAIARARYDIIAVTDAGCTLDPNWLQKITKPFDQPQPADFVGGWYQPHVASHWDESLAIVFGFAVDRVNPKTFLPSTRSMAFRKSLWAGVSGFNERNSHSEDTPFSIAMRKASKQFIFVPDAIVRWSLMQSYGAIYRTIARYALGDGEQRLWMSQYRVLTLGVLMETGLFIAGMYFGLLPWLFGAACALAYLYLPLIQTQRPRHARTIYQIPLMKMMLIAGNLIGFYRGLLRRSTSPTSQAHHHVQP